MIARIRTGATRSADADAYERYMREVALPGYAGRWSSSGILGYRCPTGRAAGGPAGAAGRGEGMPRPKPK